MFSPVWLDEYKALTEKAGLVEFPQWTQIELRGKDRHSFLHNLCTNEIRKLPANGGCEAFLTTVQGKIFSYVLIFSGPDSLVIETGPAQAERICHHLDKYLIREQVEIIDRTNEWATWLLAGPTSESVLRKAVSKGELPVELFSSTRATLANTEVWLRRVDMAGPMGYLIDCHRGDFMHVGSLLTEAGAQRAGHEAFDAVRIESGFPQFGHDITEANLPQEIARDHRAISFTKGCYLGQETVARIDALGHVNKTLVGLRYLTEHVPRPGATVLNGEEAVGTVTSATWSPRHQAPLALGYVRRGFNSPGMRLASASGPAEVEVLALA